MFARELASFVPSRIFDAHCHLYKKRFFGEAAPPLVKAGPDVDYAAFQRLIGDITPKRTTSGLFFGFPHAALDVEATNEFVAEQALLDSSSRVRCW